jgi:acyl carrier protein
MSESTQQVSIIEEIRRFIVDNFLFGQTSAVPDDDASLLENGVIDSTGVLELVSFLEENFQVQVEDAELVPENLDSLRCLSDFVRRKQAGSEDPGRAATNVS